ncbi:response regulator [bacterium]|nr:response regulator [bacterium]
MEKKRVLVIDDERIVRKVLQIQLSTLGYEVTVTGNAQEAFDALKADQYNAVICDIRLPKQRGDEILKQIVQDYPTLPVIMLTGFIDVDLAVSVMKLGAFDYINKPIKRENLAVTLSKAMSYKNLQDEKIRLEKENIKYQKMLEQKVSERTNELRKALKRLQATYVDTIRALSSTIEAKDPYIRGHSYRVSQYAIIMAKEFGASPQELWDLEFGALLHDIGKVTIENRILHKKKPLTDKEIQIIRKHPVVGENIIKNLDFYQQIRQYVRNHHEFFNGKGYPDGLKGKEIPLLVRIISLVDAFDAMNSDRAYRLRLPMDKIIRIIKEEKGKQFGPEVVEMFFKIKLYENEIPYEGSEL